MAYVNQEKKALIASELKKVVPPGWKYSLAVENRSTIVMTIYSAPINIIKAFKPTPYFDPSTATHLSVNPFHFRSQMSHIANPALAETIAQILGALNTGNYDRSDPQTDYFDVGHYVELRVGRWDKPFVCSQPEVQEQEVDLPEHEDAIEARQRMAY